MRMKRLLSLLLVVAALAALLVAPARAAGFTDISDPAVAEAAEALRVMGVLDGTGGGSFNPGGTLTRAQFSKMTVLCMGLEDQVGAYETRTIFTDVKNHWAKGYINLAASYQTGGEEDGQRLIAGVGDGTFRPDRAITYAEAVTILLRVLNYTEEASRSWPYSAVATASSTGLADGLPALSPGSAISRGQAALLFRNMLLTETKDGSMYAASIGTVTEDVVMLSANSDGVTTTASANPIKPAHQLPTSALVGRRGVLVLEKKSGKFLTFLPDKSTRLTTTVSSNATGRAITVSGGTTYSVASDVQVWNGSKQEPFSSAFSSITAGKTVTLYFDEGGSVTYIYLGSGASGTAMVAKNKVTGNPFTSLTGGVTGYSIYKNGAPAQVSDIRQYDVAVYDSAANALRISDLRLTGILENASPNLQTPDTVTLMGHEFTVLDSAINDFSDFRIGSSVTLLMTESGEVAGAVESGSIRANAVGFFEDGKITLLGSGLVLEPAGFSGNTDQLDGQLVNVSSYQKGKVSLSRITGSNASGALNVANRTVGSTALAPNVKIYDRVGDGAMTEISLDDLVQASIPASRIEFVRRDYANRIDVLVLEDATGDGYTYGMLNFEEKESPGLGSETIVNRYVTVTNAGQGQAVKDVVCGYSFSSGTMGGVALRANGKIASIIALKSVRNAVRGNFDTSAMTFATNDMVLPLSDEVQCYIKATGEWLNADGLSRALGFSERFTVYYDRAPEDGGKVRVIVVEQ